MGWFKSVGRAVTKGLKDTGHAIGNAQNNPWVKGAEAAALTASGVGAPAAALLEGGAGLVGGAIRSGGGLKGALTEGGQGALTGAAAGLTGSALRQVGSKIAGTVAQKALPSGAPSDASGMTEDQFYNSIPGGATAPAAAAAGSGAGNALTSVGSALLPKNPDGSINWGKAAQMGLAVGAGVEGMQNSKKANQYENKALDAASADYTAKAPLRTQAYANLLTPAKADDSGLFDPTNPYARKLPVVGGGSSTTAMQRFPVPPAVAPDASQAAQLSNVVQRSMATARQRMAQAGVI